MLKKLILVLVLVIFSTGVFTSCNSSRHANNDGVVTITLSDWSNLLEKQFLQQVVEKFEASNDNNQDSKIEQYGLSISPELASQVLMIKAFSGELVDADNNSIFALIASLKGLHMI